MAKLTLFTLLDAADASAAAARWPRATVLPGDAGSMQPVAVDNPSLLSLLDALQAILSFEAIRPGVDGGRVGLSADLVVANPLPASVHPIALAALPGVRFYPLSTAPGSPAHLYATRAAGVTELVVDSLPIKIELPVGLIDAPTADDAAPDLSDRVYPDDPAGFEAGVPDSVQIVLSRTGPAQIFVHVTVRMNADGGFVIEPAVPLSVGPCRFQGLPCRAIHDIGFVPSPPQSVASMDTGDQALEWARHPLRAPVDVPGGGVITIRTIDFDETQAPLDSILDRVNRQRDAAGNVVGKRTPPAEIVVEDLAFSPAGMLLPAHGRIALRQERTSPGQDPFDFAGARIEIPIGSLRLQILRLVLQTVADVADTPIQIAAGLQFGEDAPTSQALVVRVDEEWTVLVGWQAPVGAAAGPPAGGGAAPCTGLTLLKLGDVAVKLSGVKGGASIRRIAQWPRYGVKDLFAFLVDISVEKSPAAGGGGGGAIQVRSRSNAGGPLNVHIRDVGWYLGQLQLPQSISSPEGLAIVFFNTLSLFLDELGVVNESNGGKYFFFSGGFGLAFGGGGGGGGGGAGGGGSSGGSSGWSFETRFDRLRIKIGGEPTAPPWMIDGVSLKIQGPTFLLSAFAFSREYDLPAGQGRPGTNHYKEHGGGAQFKIDAGGRSYLFGLQGFYGEVKGVDNFIFLLIAAQYSPIPCSFVQIVDICALFGWNMVPRLPAATGKGEDLRLFTWYTENGRRDSVVLRGSRQLDAWARRNKSLTFAAGAGAIPSTGKQVQINLLIMLAWSDADRALLIAVEVYLIGGPEPIAWGGIEIDLMTGAWGLSVSLSITLPTIFGSGIPEWLRFVRITGSLFIGAPPFTFALGHLNDQDSWLGFRLQFPAFVQIDVVIALCVHIVDGPTGPRAGGLVISGRVTGDFGVGRIVGYVSIGAIVGAWRNESKGFAAILWFDAGLRISFLAVLELNLSARVEFDALTSSAAYRRLAAALHADLGWFLPDLDFRFEQVWMEPQLDQMTVISPPIIAADALDPRKRTQRTSSEAAPAGAAQPPPSVSVTPAAGTTIDPRAIYSMASLIAGRQPLPEWVGDALDPAPTDAAVGVSFKASVSLVASVGENTPPGAGVERNGDLTVTYELVTLGIERRPRFGALRVWRPLQDPAATRVEDLGAMSDAEIEARFQPAVAYAWDADQVRDGRLDPRRLLINSDTPYTFATANAEVDETLARSGDYPCCDTAATPQPPVRALDFAGMIPGQAPPGVQRFRDSQSTLRWTSTVAPFVVQRGDVTTQRAARVMFPAPQRTAGDGAGSMRMSSLVAGTHAGTGAGGGTSVPAPPIQFAVIDFDEPARSVVIDVQTVLGSPANLIAQLWRGLEPLGVRTFPVGAPAEIVVPEGIVTIRLSVVGTQATTLPLIDVVSASYTTVREHEAEAARALRCDARMRQRRQGRGVLCWLPNHEYRVTLTTRVTVAHARSGKQQIEIPQRVFFRTKGLPGLNAVDRVGEELAGYIESEYPAGRPLYGTEPVALAFNERFNVLAFPDPAGSEERRQVLEWVLAVDRLGGEEGRQPVSVTSADWLAARLTASAAAAPASLAVTTDAVVRVAERQAASLDPFRARQADLERSSPLCPPQTLPAPSQVLLHRPVTPGAPATATPQWEPGRVYRVNVRRRSGPVIVRPVFVAGDDVAFSYGGAPTAWTVDEDGLGPQSAPAGTSHAIFGESDWDHVRVNVAVDPAGARAGIGLKVMGSGPSASIGLAALVDASDAARPVLRLTDTSGTVLAEAPLPVPTGAARPWSLEVIAFDDQLRAVVGAVSVQAARGEARAGRVSLMATGRARFVGLSVEPIDAYRMQFTASRYRDLADHVGTFPGTTDSLPAAAIPSATFSAMLAAIPQVMKPGADPEARQRVFDQWMASLALAVRPQPDALEITRLVRNGLTEAFLLESDEPLPLADDLTVSLSQLIAVPPTLGRETLAPPLTPRLPAGSGSVPLPALSPRQVVTSLPVVVLTDGSQNRTLLISASSGAAGPRPLAAGNYQLDWTLTRTRFRADQPHPDATLRATAHTAFGWT